MNRIPIDLNRYKNSPQLRGNNIFNNIAENVKTNLYF